MLQKGKLASQKQREETSYKIHIILHLIRTSEMVLYACALASPVNLLLVRGAERVYVLNSQIIKLPDLLQLNLVTV